MKIYGIFGDPIEHSLSPPMQNAAFRAMGLDACYHAFKVSKERLKQAILGAEAMGFGGLNLTIPLKEKALGMVRPDGLAQEIGAVNTVSFEDGIWGHNTDGFGALLALEKAGVPVKGKHVLLIGAGGAAKAVAYTLAGEGAEISIANRSHLRALELAGKVGGQGYGLEELPRLVPVAEVIINATSVGMREGDPRLFPGELLNRSQIVFDVIYNRETDLLRDAARAGARTLDGVAMLVYQGAKAIEIWTGDVAPAEVMERAVRDALGRRG